MNNFLKMSSEDPLEKSLFSRIKDCVLTELRRSRAEAERASCPSRSLWIWEVPKIPKSQDSKESTREKHQAKGKDITEEKDSHRQKTESNVVKKEEKIHATEESKKASDSGAVVKSESGQHKSDEKSSCRSNKHKPVQYYLKKQNPEAPECCETHKVCPPRKKVPPHREDSVLFGIQPHCKCE